MNMNYLAAFDAQWSTAYSGLAANKLKALLNNSKHIFNCLVFPANPLHPGGKNRVFQNCSACSWPQIGPIKKHFFLKSSLCDLYNLLTDPV